MNGFWKKLGKELAVMLLTICAILALRVVFSGMYLLGIPDQENVEKIRLTYTQADPGLVESTDPRDIELAVQLTGFLKYDLFHPAKDLGEPLIAITYYEKDGTETTVSANRETVWWKGRAHALKDDEIFINLTEGIFFLPQMLATQ